MDIKGRIEAMDLVTHGRTLTIWMEIPIPDKDDPNPPADEWESVRLGYDVSGSLTFTPPKEQPLPDTMTQPSEALQASADTTTTTKAPPPVKNTTAKHTAATK